MKHNALPRLDMYTLGSQPRVMIGLMVGKLGLDILQQKFETTRQDTAGV
jgi:hypothetical protein